MLTPHRQNWRTTTLPFSLALKNTVNTGVSWSSPSNAVRNSQWWAARGFQGYGPLIQYGRGAGMDGLGGCGCGCGGSGCDGGASLTSLACLGLVALAFCWFSSERI